MVGIVCGTEYVGLKYRSRYSVPNTVLYVSWFGGRYTIIFESLGPLGRAFGSDPQVLQSNPRRFEEI